MINFNKTVYQTEYQACTISLYCWASERIFSAQFNDQRGQTAATPKFYDTAEAAINACKDMIDFLYGDVDSFQERPLPSQNSTIATYAGVITTATKRLPSQQAPVDRL